MEEVAGLVAAIFQRGAISASNHAACLKGLNQLLADESGDFPTIFHDSLLVFIFSKQLKAEAATRLREMLAKFLGAHDREQLEPKSRETLSKTLSKCMSTLKRACQVQDNDIRACCMALLAVVTELGAKWWPYVFQEKTLLQSLLWRLNSFFIPLKSALSNYSTRFCPDLFLLDASKRIF